MIAHASVLTLTLLVLSTASLYAQSTFRIDGPIGTERFHPSDSIRVSWSGNDELPVRVEVENADGRRWRFSHAAGGTGFTIPPDALPTGRYRTRLTRIRPESGTVFIATLPKSPLWGTPAISPDGRELAFASVDGLLRVWDMRSGALLRELRFDRRDPPVHDDYFSPRLKYSADGRRLLVSGEWSPRRSHIIDPATASILWSDSSGHSVDMHHDGDVVAVGNVVRRISDGSTIATVGDALETPDRLILSPDLRHALSFGWTTIALWSLETGRRVHTWTPVNETELHDVRFRPDGGAVIAVGWLPAIHAWDVLTGDVIFSLGGMPSSYGISYSPDGLRFAAAHIDGTVRVYDAPTCAPLRSIRHRDQVNGRAEFSPDDARIVVLANVEDLRIHTLETRVDTVLSEGMWEVLPPRVTLDLDGQFGTAIYPAARDSLRTAVLRNGESVALPRLSMTVEGPDAGAFGIPSYVHVRLGDSLRFVVKFRARHPGDHEATLLIVLDTDTLRTSLRGTGVLQPVQRRMTRISFGEIPIDRAVDTVVSAVIENVDSIEHAVSLELTNGSSALGFDLLEGGGDFVLAAGGTRDVALRFNGGKFARYGYSGGLRVTYDAIGSPFDIEVFAYPNDPPFVPPPRPPPPPEPVVFVQITARGDLGTTLRLTAEAREILLVDALGRTIRRLQDVSSGDVVLDHGWLVSGLYVLVVRGDAGTRVLPLGVVR